MSDEDESELSRLLPGVKRLRSDRINVYQQRQPAAATNKSNPRQIDSQTSLYETSLSAEDSHFNSGL